jgi:hypothetical protein
MLGEAHSAALSEWGSEDGLAQAYGEFGVRVLPTWPLACLYLHWSDRSDLAALDVRVSTGTATEADFAGAVVGEALDMTHQVCRSSLRVVALNQVLPLFSDDMARSRAHAYQSACPACGERLPASVVEFIGSGEP